VLGSARVFVITIIFVMIVNDIIFAHIRNRLGFQPLSILSIDIPNELDLILALFLVPIHFYFLGYI